LGGCRSFRSISRLSFPPSFQSLQWVSIHLPPLHGFFPSLLILSAVGAPEALSLSLPLSVPLHPRFPFLTKKTNKATGRDQRTMQSTHAKEKKRGQTDRFLPFNHEDVSIYPPSLLPHPAGQSPRRSRSVATVTHLPCLPLCALFSGWLSATDCVLALSIREKRMEGKTVGDGRSPLFPSNMSFLFSSLIYLFPSLFRSPPPPRAGRVLRPERIKFPPGREKEKGKESSVSSRLARGAGKEYRILFCRLVLFESFVLRVAFCDEKKEKMLT